MPPGQGITAVSPNDSRFPRGATYMRRSVTGKPLHLVGSLDSAQELTATTSLSSSEPWKALLPDMDAKRPKKREFLHEQSKGEIVSEFLQESPKKHLEPVANKPEPKPQKTPAVPRQSRSQVLHRSSFGPKVVAKTRRRIRRRHRSSTSVALVSMAAFLFIIGLGVSFNAWRINRLAKSQVAVLAKNTDNQQTSDVPDETEPDSSSAASYNVAADLPRFLRIPKIQVDAKVKRLGVKSDNELKAPSNIFDVGWYDGSAKPGENGTILLDGHVSGPTKRGVFYSLASLKTGDVIDIERGDSQIFHYKVVKSVLYDYDKVDMAAALTSAVPGKPGLNLMTCGGKFDVRTNKFEQRLVVFAVRQ